METLRYSIIYAVIRSEIAERLSLGLITVADGQVDVRYSDKKLRVLESLYSPKDYQFISKTIRSLYSNKNVISVDTINYLARYSNNLMTVSQLQGIDLAPTKQSKDWLFRRYVYAGK